MVNSSPKRFFPVRLAGAHTVELEAALTACLADPSHKAVHQLRKETRRLEALLVLLADLPDISRRDLHTERLRRCLRKLRRAAGEVRDLDVHRERLDEIAGGSTAPDGAGEARKGEKLIKAARNLNKRLLRQRRDAGEDLQEELRKCQRPTAVAAEAWLASLAPEQGLSLTAKALLERVGAKVHDGLLAESLTRDLTGDELHTLRKTAKAARYLAEMLPASPAATAAARRFERLQESGGRWHDALELAAIAKRELGGRQALTQKFSEERDDHLWRYRDALRREATRLRPLSP